MSDVSAVIATPPPGEVAPPLPPEPSENTSLSAHQAQFSPLASQRETVPTEAPIETEAPSRHRANSQKATADDVQEIATLTKTLRAKEAELAKAKPDALTGSPRVLTLKRQIRAIEADLADLTPAPAAPPPPPRVDTAPARPAATPSTFTEPEPKLEDFEKEPDPYTALSRALARWDRRKEDHETQHATATRAQQAAVQAQQQAFEQKVTEYHTHLAAFRKVTPDFDTKMQPLQNTSLPAVLMAAIYEAGDKGPQFTYSLINDRDVLDEMIIKSAALPLTPDSVALMRRRLDAQLTRTQAAATGSAAAMPSTSWTSRPPNPVRTSPMTTGDDPPGDGHSLADHRKHFGQRRR